MTDTPNILLPLVPEGTLDPAAGLNLALIELDALVQTTVIRMDLSAPPGSPSDGALYIVDPPGTGAWAGQDSNLARYVADGAFWQFYQAGAQVKLIVNADDGGIYSFDGASGGPWKITGGLPDAPVDGTTYGRKDAAWEPVSGFSISFADEETTPLEVSGVSLVVIGPGLTLESSTDGQVRLDVAAGSSAATVITESGTSRTAQSTDFHTYVRFTNAAAKTYTFDSAEGYTVGHEFHGRNAGAGDLEIAEAGSMTINPPAEGTLFVPQDGTFTVKIVASGVADLFGVTVLVS